MWVRKSGERLFKDLEKEVSWTATEQQKEKVYIRDKQSSLNLSIPYKCGNTRKNVRHFKTERGTR